MRPEEKVAGVGRTQLPASNSPHTARNSTCLWPHPLSCMSEASSAPTSRFMLGYDPHTPFISEHSAYPTPPESLLCLITLSGHRPICQWSKISVFVYTKRVSERQREKEKWRQVPQNVLPPRFPTECPNIHLIFESLNIRFLAITWGKTYVYLKK